MLKRTLSFAQTSLFVVCISISALAVGQTEKSVPFDRIVSAGGSITEILYSLGLFDKVVAVDSSSLYPEKTTSLPKVGYFRSLGAEGVLSLSPDLLITARGAGPESVLSQIEQAGVTVRTFEQAVYTKESWKALITEIGELFNRERESQKLIDKVTTNIATSASMLKQRPKTIKAIALLNSGERGTTLAGRNTMPDFLFSLLGVNNLAESLNGYKPFSPEALAANDVDLILVPAHNLQDMGGIKGVCANQAIALATNGSCNVLVMDPLLLLGFGARIDQAVEQLAVHINSLPE